MKMRFIFPFLVTLLVIIVFHYTNVFAVKFYPVGANFTIFLIFLTSSFAKETVIQKFAKALEKTDKLDDFTENYTRKLTYCWAVFTFFNFLVSIFTLFLSEKWWALYNGVISYALIGTFFAVEYIVRVILRKKYKQ